MSNIAISELTIEATTLNDNDLLLVSKNSGTSYTSAKMRGSVLKSGVSGCQFSEDSVKNALTSYGAVKSTDLSNLSTLTASDIKTQCQNAISSTAVLNSGSFITYDVSKFIELSHDTYTELEYDSYVLFSVDTSVREYTLCILYAKYGNIELPIYRLNTVSTSHVAYSNANILLPMKKGTNIKYKLIDDDTTLSIWYSCMIMPCI